MWYGHPARHRQDACATSFTSEMETLYRFVGWVEVRNPTGASRAKPNPLKEAKKTVVG